MAKKNAATAKKPSLKERMAVNQQGVPDDQDNVDEAGGENERDPSVPQEGDETDPALNAPIEGAEDEDGEPDDGDDSGAMPGEGDPSQDDDAAGAPSSQSDEDDEAGDEAPDPVDANVAIGAFLFSDPRVKRTADMKFDEAGQWIPGADDEPEDDPFEGMDEMTIAKLTALKETYGAKGFRLGETKKNRPQVFHMVNEEGNDFASGTLEDLAFLALTFEKKAPAADEAKPVRGVSPDPILKSKKRHPINSFHDMQTVLRDDGRFMTFERVVDDYEVKIFDEVNPKTAICKGTVPLNATKEDLTRFYWKAKKIK